MRQKNKGMKKTGVLGFVILCLLSGCAQQSTESTEATTVAAVEGCFTALRRDRATARA